MTSQLTETAIPNDQKIPPLENGDHLTCPEFERRYAAMPNLKKAELIEGMVYMAAALRLKQHGEPHSHLIIWLGNYKVFTPGLMIADNTTVRLDQHNVPQPDVALFLDPNRGGQATITADDYLAGAPELIAEVAGSSAAYDLGVKKDVYRRHGVKEYLVWQMFENRLDWFVLDHDHYTLLHPDQNGILKSQFFPGLWLDQEALLQGEMSQVLAVLQQGIQSPEHQQFVQDLANLISST
jgi:Uma2 family endonuclease